MPEPQHVKNRVHLDLRAADIDGELARLIGLGARAVERQANPDLVVLADPEANEFCLLRR